MIKPELWILLALKDASQGYGFGIRKWFLSEKPDEFDINNTDFENLIDTLEKQGIIKRALKEPVNFYLSNKGKKELTDLKRQLKFKEYYHIISNFPGIELKERVKSLESFVVLSISLAVMFRLGQYFSSYINDTIYFILFLFFYFFMLIVAYYVGSNLGGIVLFWINNMQKETLWKYEEWLWNNQGKIKNVIAVSFIVLIIFLLDYLQLYKWKDSSVAVVLGLISIYIYEKFLKKGST